MVKARMQRFTRIHINVVKDADFGGLLFQHKDVLFNQIAAIPAFIGGELRIYRDGQLLDQTTIILKEKFCAPGALFLGLNRLYKPGNPLSWRVRSLEPNEFLEGDKVVLKILQNRNFNFVLSLRTTFYKASARVIASSRGLAIDEHEVREEAIKSLTNAPKCGKFSLLNFPTDCWRFGKIP
jgi:hypothetical protein